MNYNHDRNGDGDTYHQILRNETLKALHSAPLAVDQLLKTEAGRRLLKVYVHVALRGHDLTAEDWIALATLCRASAHGLNEPAF